MNPVDAKLYRRHWAIVALSFGFLSFVGGFVVTTLQVFPYSFLRDAFLGLQTPSEDYASTDRYVRVAATQIGVSRYKPELAYNGYTLFTSGDSAAAYLIDMSGRIVHEWRLPYDQVWNRDAAVESPGLSKFTFWRKAVLYPNGDLLAVYECWNEIPFGYGLVKIDRNSRIIWSFLERVHHSVSVDNDGVIYTLSHRMTGEQIAGLPAFAPSHYEDFVDVLSPDGKLLKQISLLHAFAKSPYRGLVELQREQEDPLHTNNIRPVPTAWAKKLGLNGSHYVLLSFRLLDSLALLDLDSATIAWVQHGPFARQHNAELLPDGDITVFDNVGDMQHDAQSRVLEFSPSPFRIVWEFPGNSGEKLDSSILGTAQRLANGNTLITESRGGRLLEVTPDRRVVWEYRTPFRYGDKHQFAAILLGGRRFAPNELQFDFNRTPEIEPLMPAKGGLHEASLKTH